MTSVASPLFRVFCERYGFNTSAFPSHVCTVEKTTKELTRRLEPPATDLRFVILVPSPDAEGTFFRLREVYPVVLLEEDGTSSGNESWYWFTRYDEECLFDHNAVVAWKRLPPKAPSSDPSPMAFDWSEVATEGFTDAGTGFPANLCTDKVMDHDEVLMCPVPFTVLTMESQDPVVGCLALGCAYPYVCHYVDGDDPFEGLGPRYGWALGKHGVLSNVTNSASDTDKMVVVAYASLSAP